MIFASDLDQTLIYSRRSIGVPEGSEGLVPVEWIDGKLSAYMSESALQELQLISRQITFVPVTTRTVEQYQRIRIFQQEFIPAYAITSNGGNILIDGQVEASWNERIRAQLSKNAAAPDEVMRLFKPVMSDEWVIGGRLCDELFFAYVIQRDNMPLEAVMDTIGQLDSLGWEASIQGRKLYLVPSAVNKHNAVEHIRQLVGAEAVLASGDSLLDRCLLDGADYAIAPRHGELYREQQRNPELVPYVFTEQSGVFAANEILDYVRTTYQALTGEAAS